MSDDHTTVNWCKRSHEQAARIEGLLVELEAYKAVAVAARHASDCERKCAGKCPALPHEIDDVWTNLRIALDALRATEVEK